MKDLTNRIKNGARNLVLYGAVALGLAFGTGEAQSQEQTENYKHFVNPYIAPREIKDYWGSGDTNNDGVINQADATAMQAGTANYRTDVDGDGAMSTSADLTLLKKYLNGEIKYLPGHWNKLESVAERKNWFKKMLAIDDTNYFREGWSCGNYSSNLFYNMNWVENITNWEQYNTQNRIYDLSDLGIFNLLVYRVNTTAKNGGSHAINGIFLGSDTTFEDNSTNFKYWLFLEPQTDEEITPGNFSMDENKPVKVGGYTYRYSNILNRYSWELSRLLEWNLNNGTPSLYFQNQDLVTTRPSSSGIDPGCPNTSGYSLSVFPNPFTCEINVSLPEFQNVWLYLMDWNGRVLFKTPCIAPLMKIRESVLGKLPAGAYFIQAGRERQTVVKVQ